MTAHPTTLPPLGTQTRRARLAPWVDPLVAAGAVLAFWWGATGVLFALQRSTHTRVVALAVAVAAGTGGLALTARVRRARPGARTAAGGVLAGALLWTAVSAAFYSGWVVGPGLAAGAVAQMPGAAPSLARAVEAITATASSTLLAVALFGLAVRAAAHPRDTRDASQAAPSEATTLGVTTLDTAMLGTATLGTATAGGSAPGGARFAPFTFGVLWAAHELAKLNVFLGVANPGAELLPAYLAPLRVYFGPARNSPLLAASVAGLATAAAVATRAAARTADPARRAGFALVAGILALAALEHALLGTRAPVGWWDIFLRWRGTP